MTTFSLKYEDRLEGPYNFAAYICHFSLILKEHGPCHPTKKEVATLDF